MIDRRYMAAVVLAACVAGGAAGCLSVPEGPEPMCKIDDDCNRGSGEVCDEGICWGNPPAGPFSAVISPPSSRHDLVPRELAQVSIFDFGWISELVLEPPVTFSGRIVEFCPPPMIGCNTAALGATITVSRPTLFHGGPGFTTVVNVKPGEAFAIPVPRTRVGDEPYTVVVVPNGGSQANSGPIEDVPPLHARIPIGDNSVRMIALGGADLPVISGTLTDSLGSGLLGYRVVALGRWDASAPPTEVSTVDFVDAMGNYEVILSDELIGTVEIVARPPAGMIAPTIRMSNFDATRTATRSLVLPTTLGRAIAPAPAVTVTGLDRSGMISPVRGAVVSVTATLIAGLTSFTITDEQVTGNDGRVALRLLDGTGFASLYRMSITPPASSSLGVVFDQKLIPGDTPVRLPVRIAVRGRLLDLTGKPIPNVTVTARPSLRFLWTLDAVPQAFVAAIPPPTAVTPDTTSGTGAGDFVLWVDPTVATIWGHYDLLVEPPANARAPAFLIPEVGLKQYGTLESIELGDVTVPEAAFIRGLITGPDGVPVENAELRLYLVPTGLALCTEVAHAPVSCPIPAPLQGRSTSDDEGIVRLTLPR